MPPSLAARDSPRAQHGRRRAPRSQLVRSGSFFGALKNLVTAPLSWITGYEDQENAMGKRGRAGGGIVEDEGRYSEGQPSAKRKRVDSPEPDYPSHTIQQPTRSSQGYLDVPENMLPRKQVSRHRPATASGHGRSSSLFTSLAVPTNGDAHPARRTASPTGIVAFTQPSTLQRTQSMDPPQYRPLSLSRDVSMEDGVHGSASRDVTMSPSRRTPFQLRARSSLTPQPTGQTFGPQPRHKERDSSEPPPLAALMSKPVFVKPPPQVSQPRHEQPVTTLGTIAEATGRTSRSPMRQHSGLFLGARPGSIAQSSSTPIGYPTNVADLTYNALEAYRTPLLPSRLRDSQTIPDMFKPKKSHAPVLMRADRERDRKPRLGMSEKKGKKKDEKATATSKPYAGRGGMKKMLARRKLEEREELEKERASAIETDQDEIVDSVTEARPVETAEIFEPTAPVSSARPSGGREQSSLRVGRTRISRNHIARPVTKSKNRFSAVFDDEDVDDNMGDDGKDTLEEPKKMPTLFESPKGFTFAPEKAPVLQDSSNAREPPIAALPFSFSKSSAAPAAPAAVPPFSFGEPTKPLASGFVPVTAPAETPVPKTQEVQRSSTTEQATPLFPPIPSIALVPPSPAQSKSVDETPAPSSVAPAIPNFFANSSIFSKPGVTITPPTLSAAALPSQAGKAAQEGKVELPSSLFGTPPVLAPFSAPVKETPVPSAPEASKPAFSFTPTVAAPAVSSVAPAPSLFASTAAPAKDTPATESTTSFFTAPQPSSAPASATIATPAPVNKEPSPSLFSFGVPPKATEPPASSTNPFSFGAPPANATTAPASTPSASPFSFGQPSSDPAKPAEIKTLFGAGDPPKQSLFGAPEPSKPSVFGVPAPTPSPFGGSQGSTSAEAPKPFTFGQSSVSTSTSIPAIEAPKPLFPSTSSGGSGGFTFGSSAPAAPTPSTPVKSPFSFGASAPTIATPVDNKPAFSFGTPTTPSVSAPTTLFGGPSNNSQSADNKAFSFGSTAPARPITPPQKEQEMQMMEESPTRGMDMGNEQPQQSLNSIKPSGGFTFGASTTSSPFGQPSQPASSPFAFGANNQTKVETKPTSSFASFGQNASSSPFGFGQKPAESTQSPVSAPFGNSNPFGQSITPSTTASPFAFGTSTSGGFGQASQPASPSTFGQPSTAPFGFGVTPTSATAPSNPFAFGSQPASPASGSAGLPQPPGSSGGGFTFGASSPATTQAPSSPFGAAPSLPQPAGGIGFTMGSAAPPQAGGARNIKKLPNRRGGRAR